MLCRYVWISNFDALLFFSIKATLSTDHSFKKKGYEPYAKIIYKINKLQFILPVFFLYP